MILQSTPRELALVHLLLPFCQDLSNSFVEIFIYFCLLKGALQMKV